MKTDSRIGGGSSAQTYRHPLLSCISVFLQCLATVADPKAKRRLRWTPQAASTTAVLMAIDADSALTGRFQHARSCMKRDYRGRRRTGSTYNGLLKALERQQETSLPIMKKKLRAHARPRIDPVSPWLLLARKTAGTIYRKRWGVEIFYRTLKRTWGCAKLRSKAARRARIELEWTLVALTITTLLGIDATLKRRRDPRRLSPAQLIRTLRETLRRNDAQGPHACTMQRKAMSHCLKDSYQRKGSKHSRHRIITRDTPKTRLQPPLIQKATAQERQQALKHQQNIAA